MHISSPILRKWKTRNAQIWRRQFEFDGINLSTTLFVFLCLVSLSQAGPAISGLDDRLATEEGKEAGQEAGERRHAFGVLEPELAENIFRREGARNPLQRTTIRPPTKHKLPSSEGNNEKLLVPASSAPRAQAPVLPGENLKAVIRKSRAAAAREYDLLNEDFATEYDALNLDFNLDERQSAKEGKEQEVPAKEIIWQEGHPANKTGKQNGQDGKKDEKKGGDGEEQEKEKESGETEEEVPFPPKEWWGDEDSDGEATTAGMVESSTAATTMTTNEEESNSTTSVMPGRKEEMTIGKEMRMKANKLLTKWPGDSDGHKVLLKMIDEYAAGSAFTLPKHRGRRDLMQGVPTTESSTTATDGQQLKVLPKLVRSRPPPALVRSTTTTSTFPSPTTSFPHSSAQSRIDHRYSQSLLMPKGQRVPQAEFLRDLPSSADEPNGFAGEKATGIVAEGGIVPGKQQISPPSKTTIGTIQSQQQSLAQATQNSSNDSLHLQPSHSGQFVVIQPGANRNHQHRHPVPPGFQYIAALAEPPQRIGSNEILVDGQRYWVERTVPISEFLRAQNAHSGAQHSPVPQKGDNKNNKTPVNLQLPPLFKLPALDENTEGFINPKIADGTSQNERQPDRSLLKSDWLELQQKRGPRPAAAQANSARVLSLSGQDIPIGTGISGAASEQHRQLVRSSKNKFPDNRSGLFALNLGAALSQIFGNFTIEHDDAKKEGGIVKSNAQMASREWARQNSGDKGGGEEDVTDGEGTERNIDFREEEAARETTANGMAAARAMPETPQIFQQAQPRFTRYYDRVVVDANRGRHLHGN